MRKGCKEFRYKTPEVKYFYYIIKGTRSHITPNKDVNLKYEELLSVLRVKLRQCDITVCCLDFSQRCVLHCLKNRK